MAPGFSDDIDIEMPALDTKLDWLGAAGIMRAFWAPMAAPLLVRFDMLTPAKRTGELAAWICGKDALKSGEFDVECCWTGGDVTVGFCAGSMSSELGKLLGKTVAPLVSTLLIRQHAMLNSFLSSLPSLFRSARPQICPRIGVARLDFKKNSRAFSPVNRPFTAPRLLNEASCFVLSSIVIFHSILFVCFELFGIISCVLIISWFLCVLWAQFASM